MVKAVRSRGEDVRRFLLEHIDVHAGDIAPFAAKQLGITRQAVGKHLRRLLEEGAITQTGETRARRYALATVSEWTRRYRLGDSPAEDVIWRKDVEPVIGTLPDNVSRIWHIGFTEMFNNAIDHSEGTIITLRIDKTAVSTAMLVTDNGVGIFRKIQGALGLLDERHAVLELAKGKLTTDPARHSGEGIFFTSRMFDDFRILSGGVYFDHKYGTNEDWILEPNSPKKGTTVWMELSNHTARSSAKVYAKFASATGEHDFGKTIVPVDLARYGDENLVSRSQAKRVLARVDMFKVVIFDFAHVPAIGQAFADEIFRVFALQHPLIEIHAINANAEVRSMIERATAR
ncbi:MAG TPA: DUF4325 domain-containing protein [Povalibacter sp.]|uniref:STAS-like domain-containing protein n=1 Tax=Povalibacter sp. TaxID=1962978 RepID=UPI002C80C1CF|nr:DUF4325 domain-containing protein [Povalibacter sp.]HMN44978.1 DUF4325 domain-containing protein [Povalibacter sp.]